MDLIEQLKRDEGKSTEMYLDTRGFLTIGYGHLLRGGHDLSDVVCEQILRDDVAATESEVRQTMPWIVTLSSARHGALMNLAFTVGINGLQGFHKMLAALQDQAWAIAARELLNSAYARQVGARADRLARQMREDVWV